MEKPIDCGHKLRVPCRYLPSQRDCTKKCTKILPCGHECRNKCGEPCSQKGCNKPIEVGKVKICGHQVVITCGESRSGLNRLQFLYVNILCYLNIYTPVGKRSPTESELALQLETCKTPCRAVLGCKHTCKGSCGECLNGRLHRSCVAKCGRILVCGHR